MQLFLILVRFLSNLFSRSSRSRGPVAYGNVPPDRIGEALEILLATPGAKAPMGQMVAFMQSAKARGMDLSHIRVAMCDNHILYAVLPSVLPGRTLMFISGSPLSAQAAPAARELIGEAIRKHESPDIRLMQVLVETHDTALRGIYESCGFHMLAELVYLEAPGRKTAWHLPDAAWDTIPYSAQTHAQFAEAILASYQDTLDCPGLNGIRGIDDVIAGHKASGDFDPANWLLLRHAGAPSGVLLLAKVPASDALELIYIGLCPSARGKGLGNELIKVATSRVAELGCKRLTTAVDAQNAPAMRMYLRMGMERIGSRVAMIRSYPHQPAT